MNSKIDSRLGRQLHQVIKRASPGLSSTQPVSFAVLLGGLLLTIALMWFTGTSGPLMVQIFLASLLVVGFLVQLIKQHYMLKRIEMLEQQIVHLSKSNARPKSRVKTQQSIIDRFFDKNSTLH